MRDRASGVHRDILEHLPPKKTRVCLLYCFVLSPLISLGALPQHHLTLSVKELTYTREIRNFALQSDFSHPPYFFAAFNHLSNNRLPSSCYVPASFLPMHSSCLGNFLGAPIRQNLHLLIVFSLNVFFKGPPSKFSHIHIEYLGLVEAIFREIVAETLQAL